MTGEFVWKIFYLNVISDCPKNGCDNQRVAGVIFLAGRYLGWLFAGCGILLRGMNEAKFAQRLVGE
jgi:hypothetical protein